MTRLIYGLSGCYGVSGVELNTIYRLRTYGMKVIQVSQSSPEMTKQYHFAPCVTTDNTWSEKSDSLENMGQKLDDCRNCSTSTLGKKVNVTC